MLKLINKIFKGYLIARGISIGNQVTLHLTSTINNKNGSISIGPQCELSKGTILKAYGGRISLAKNTFLGEYVCIYGHGGVEVGENTLIAMHTCIVSSNHTIPNKKDLIRYQPDIALPVKIGNDVWIGAGCKILGGVTIGDGCVVGAGSVVSKDLAPYSVAIGVPAKIIRYREDAI
ncbi:acyltransferase [Pedobacter sandarakinus]|uniref:acyltransferase n=1 Tax=Pedobacter sandarakinus TaxID=353156 RepID=UPI002245DC18|nr:acyltransferase [Pedobacter sandarakinus]MCX2575920.1 acyltransferase [Pedobacter sandarakinus]